MNFFADRVTISKEKADGSIEINFSVGENMRDRISELLTSKYIIKGKENIAIAVEVRVFDISDPENPEVLNTDT